MCLISKSYHELCNVNHIRNKSKYKHATKAKFHIILRTNRVFLRSALAYKHKILFSLKCKMSDTSIK